MLKSYIGNCANSFDELSDCIVPQLPYSDVSSFAYYEEEYIEITKDLFLKNVQIPQFSIECHIFFYDINNDVFISYNENTDIHYFYN